VNPAQLSLAWLHARGKHVVSIPGTTNIQHLEENIARWDWVIPAEITQRIDAMINQKTVAGRRYAASIQKVIDTEEFDGQ